MVSKEDIGNFIEGGVNSLDKLVNRSNDKTRFTDQDGFSVPAIPTTDGNLLPHQKIPARRQGQFKRRMVSWFVPEIGVIKMYVNPQSIGYNNSKLINKERTKGGFVLSYWGEELEELTIQGTTGSSGIEGINVLMEVYRAEQYVFDNYGLILAARENANSLLNTVSSNIESLSDSIGGTLGSVIGGSLTAVSDVLLGGSDPISQLKPNNTPTLASLAFSIEMFYQGWVRRGFFKSMTVTENASSPGWFDYTINFTVTQKRGYRQNFMPWHRSPLYGPSDNRQPNNLSF